MAFYADRLFPRLAASHSFLKGYHAANAGTWPCGFTVPDGVPAKLVACRGIPIAPAMGRSLGPLPDVKKIPARTAGAEWMAGDRAKETLVMQVVSSVALTNFYAQCDNAAGNRLPVLFEEAVMAFVMPRVKEDGTLVSVAFVNASIDRQDPVALRLRGVPTNVQVAVWHQPEAEPVEIGLVRCGGDVRVRLPRIGAWECGYLIFK